MNPVTCANCGQVIDGHSYPALLECLTSLSGKIKVYRKKIEEDKT